MSLCMEIGFGPGHIVLDGDPALPVKRATAPTEISSTPILKIGIIRSFPGAFSSFTQLHARQCVMILLKISHYINHLLTYTYLLTFRPMFIVAKRLD